MRLASFDLDPRMDFPTCMLTNGNAAEFAYDSQATGK